MMLRLRSGAVRLLKPRCLGLQFLPPQTGESSILGPLRGSLVMQSTQERFPMPWHHKSINSRGFCELLLGESVLSTPLTRALGFRAAGKREDLIFKAQGQESKA